MVSVDTIRFWGDYESIRARSPEQFDRTLATIVTWMDRYPRPVAKAAAEYVGQAIGAGFAAARTINNARKWAQGAVTKTGNTILAPVRRLYGGAKRVYNLTAYAASQVAEAVRILAMVVDTILTVASVAIPIVAAVLAMVGAYDAATRHPDPDFFGGGSSSGSTSGGDFGGSHQWWEGEGMGNPQAWNILDLDPKDSTEEDVRKAYQEKVKETHPDQGGSAEEFMDVQEAKDTLLGK